MKPVGKRLLGVAGIVTLVAGLTSTIPASAHENTSFLIVSGIFVILGVILIAISYGD